MARAVAGRPRARWLALALAATLTVSAAVAASGQVRVWRSGETLWRHALAVTPDNDIAHQNLAVLLDAAGSWHVRNESRTAGTRVNGQSVEHAPLRPGDVVQLGRVRLEVVDPKRVNPSAGGGRSAAHPEVRAS